MKKITTPHSGSTEQSNTVPIALYQKIKDHVCQKIHSGEWCSGDRISSEAELVTEFGASRMTVNRALRELTMQGKLTRLAGVGTFVAEPKQETTLLMISNIGEEIRARGHTYRCAILTSSHELATAEIATIFNLHVGAPIFYLVCVHYEDDVPVRLEERYVNPVCAPDFLSQDFNTIEPSEYLLNIIPADEYEHIVDAVLPSKNEAELLGIKTNQPCLVLSRRTWSNGVPVTKVRFTHPGARYRLGGRFKDKHS